MKLNTQNMLSVFDNEGEIIPRKLFTSHFNSFSNHIHIEWVDGFAMFNSLKQQITSHIILELKKSKYSARAEEDEIKFILCMLDTEEMLYAHSHCLTYYYRKEHLFSEKKIKEESIRHKLQSQQKHKIHILTKDAAGYRFKPFEIKDTEIDIKYYYNDDILIFDKKITEQLNEEINTGIVLLHGRPGTGKTTYIRYLVSKLNKPIVYIPPGMAEALSHPDFIDLLYEEKGNILLIEDAEKAIISRNYSNDNAVATLLNLSDGLMSDIMKMKIICTFNTDIKNIDKALLRPGRLIGKYEFGELAADKTQLLSERLGLNRHESRPMTLAEIFSNESYDENIILNGNGIIGFKQNAISIA